MLKIVVFDSGWGGELFADYLEETLPVVKVIRVIDWRNSNAITSHAKSARVAAEAALRPYLGDVDLIVFANHLLSLTSLRYFRRKYPQQEFIGMTLDPPRSPVERNILVLTTRAVHRSVSYRHLIWRLGTGKCKTLTLDDWPAKIDDGELTSSEISQTFVSASIKPSCPHNIVLACSQFSDIREQLYDYFNKNIKIYDGFEDTLQQICRILKIRGGTGRRKH